MTQIRPLSPDESEVEADRQTPPGPRGPGRRWALAIVAAVVGLALGMVAGILTAGEESADEDALVTVPTEPVDTADGSTTIVDGPTLDSLIPEFTGTLAWVDRSTPIRAVRWNATQTRGGAVDLPSRTRATMWNADATKVAALVSGERFDSLAVQIDTSTTPIAVGVTGFAWHAADPDRIAWVEDGKTLWNAESPGWQPQPVLTLGPDDATPFGGTVLAWGDWGYLVHLPGRLDDPPGPVAETLSVDPSGNVVGRTEMAVLAASASGELVLQAEDGTVSVTGPELVSRRTMEWNLISNALFSPDGSQLAGLVDRDASVALEIQGDKGVLAYRLSALDGLLVGWSQDGRFIAVLSSSVSSGGGRGSGIIVVDLVDRSTHTFTVDALTAAIH